MTSPSTGVFKFRYHATEYTGPENAAEFQYRQFKEFFKSQPVQVTLETLPDGVRDVSLHFPDESHGYRIWLSHPMLSNLKVSRSFQS